jgi:hypothetical protein
VVAGNKIKTRGIQWQRIAISVGKHELELWRDLVKNIVLAPHDIEPKNVGGFDTPLRSKALDEVPQEKTFPATDVEQPDRLRLGLTGPLLKRAERPETLHVVVGSRVMPLLGMKASIKIRSRSHERRVGDT